ncbi:MAG: polysaccharide pyruvyl transferase CsaB, partial [Clostridia bacterium]|nr:polysaccharide pyruvyl transferase CsaB [Clostridia bacterium]
TKVIYSSFTAGDYCKLIKFIKAENPDIVHCHGAKANLAGILIKLFCKKTIVTTVHSDYRLDYMHSALKRITIGRINTAALRIFDYYTTVSDRFKNMLIERKFKPNKIMAIYNGLDFTQKCEPADRKTYLNKAGLDYSDKDVIIGIPARLNPVKDIPTLLRAFAKAKKTNPDLKLLIGGDGEEAEKLKQIAADLGISDSTAFLGWVDNVPEFFSVCDIDVLCSISESFPYSVLEGIREGCAIITSDVGGMNKLIDNGVNGYIFKPGDVDTFAEYIIDLSSDREKRERFSSLLFKKASDMYSVENMAKTQIGIYEKILKLESYAKNKYGVLICGAYGRGNSGDESILKAIIDSMHETDPVMPVTVMTKQPMKTALSHSVNTVYTFNVPAFLKEMKKAAIFINGGGNLIQDSTSSRSLLFYLYTIRAAKKKKCKVVMYGCGIGKVSKKQNRKITKYVLNKYADVISLRDRLSFNDLEDMGVTKPKIILSADPAFSIKPASEYDASYYLSKQGVDPDGKYICFSLREWKGIDKFDQFAAAANYAYEKYGLTPVFLPIEVPRDQNAASAVASKLNCPYHMINPSSDASLTISLFGKMTVVCAMRLHALVFAAASGSPFIAASYDIKVDGFMDYVSCSDLCCKLENISSDWMCSRIDKIMTEGFDSPAKDLRILEAENRKSVSELM